MTYAEKLQDPRWQKKRLEILERDNWTCRDCGRSDVTLNVHHKAYLKGKSPWEYDGEYLQTLCKTCHEERSEFLVWLQCVFQNGDLKTATGYALVNSLADACQSITLEKVLAVLSALATKNPDSKIQEPEKKKQKRRSVKTRNLPHPLDLLEPHFEHRMFWHLLKGADCSLHKNEFVVSIDAEHRESALLLLPKLVRNEIKDAVCAHVGWIDFFQVQFIDNNGTSLIEAYEEAA